MAGGFVGEAGEEDKWTSFSCVTDSCPVIRFESLGASNKGCFSADWHEATSFPTSPVVKEEDDEEVLELEYVCGALVEDEDDEEELEYVCGAFPEVRLSAS